MRILAVDDNVTSLRYIKSVLDEVEKTVIVPSSVRALDFVKKEKPLLVVMDVFMPEIDGFETVNRIRSIEGCEKVPVIFLSGEDGEEVRNKCAEYINASFLLKPVSQDSLKGEVERVLKYQSLI